jgi:hypothetical protein
LLAKPLLFVDNKILANFGGHFYFGLKGTFLFWYDTLKYHNPYVLYEKI